MIRLSPPRRMGAAARLPRPTSRARLGAFLAVLFVAGAFAGAALAVNFYNTTTLNPGAFASTFGWNNRDYNRACRDDATGNWGWVEAAYINTGGSIQYTSNPQFTRCGAGDVARVEENGYFKCRCWNRGTISFRVVCQTDTG